MWTKKTEHWGQHHQNYRCVDLTMMHICTIFERNPSRNVACSAHTRFPPKYDPWPYKRRNTRGSITKNNRRVDFTKIYLHTKFERNPSRNAAVRAHTRMWRQSILRQYLPGDTINYNQDISRLAGRVLKNVQEFDHTPMLMHQIIKFRLSTIKVN